ncbi:MAG: Arsenical resistance operon repressor [Alphaproteobacteria bacterium ADurb.Bin438]|nr:MAG: Arsenical resistance operon repressor [Alphaproteobacteria bacterium ADurb.Bin438]
MDIKQATIMFSALSQENRIMILKEIMKHGKQGLCPCHLVEKFELSNANLSFHLKELVNANLITKQKQGKFINYQANCEQIRELGEFLIETCPICHDKV